LSRARLVRFLIVGIVASTASLVVQQLVIRVTDSPVLAAWIRLAFVMPVLYIGYSRFMLRELLRAEQAELGWWPTERRMAVRVVSSAGASTALKLLLEPPLAVWFDHRFGPSSTAFAALIGDYGYGPLAGFLVIDRLSRRRARAEGETVLAAPVTVRTVAALTVFERLLVALVFTAAWASRRWTRSRGGNGDVARMTLVDRLHWLYKAGHPVVRPRHGEPTPPPIAPRIELVERAPSVRRIELSAVGDLLPPIGPPSPELYDAISDLLFGADLSFANLEAPVSASTSPLRLSRRDAPRLSMTPGQLDALVTHRGRHLRAVSMANNHTADFGEAGVVATHREVVARGVQPVGVAPPGGATTAIVEAGGIRVGFLAATFGLNGFSLAAGSDWTIDAAPLNDAGDGAALGLVERRVAALRHGGCDLVVASLHWGLEWELVPTARQRQVAAFLATLGCDLVLGHHPHVVQPVEVLTDPGTGSRTVVCYSLGNAVSPLFFPANALGLLFRCTIALPSDGPRRAIIERFALEPFVQLVSGDGDERRSRLEPLALARRRPWSDPDSRRFIDRAARYANLIVDDGPA
jgi:poly-gamma-glutamate synthesis protein (capsule biosynthesis protein)